VTYYIQPNSAGSSTPPSNTTVDVPGFVMPAVNANVNIPVTSVAGMYPGAQIFIVTAGSFLIASIPDGTHVVATNMGGTNAPPTTAIAAGELVTVMGAAVTFAAVRAALALANLSVPFNGQELTGVADGTASTSAATVGQTYYTPYAAPAGPATVLPAIVGQVYRMGGTVAAPNAYEPIIHVYPRDTARGPFCLFGGTALALSTWDPTWQLGYNADISKVAEPSAFVGFEGDFEYSAGNTQCEMYFQFGLGGTSLAVGGRPLFATMDRASADIKTTMDFGAAAASSGAEFWTVSSRYNGNAITATNDHVYIRRGELGVFLFDSATNAQYTGIGFTGAGGFNLYDQPTYGGVRRFTTGNAKPTVTGALSTAVTVAQLIPILRSLIDCFNNLGTDQLIDTTT
jgi:hypothetical protein